MKPCTQCGRELDIECFKRRGIYKNGESKRHPACRGCMSFNERIIYKLKRHIQYPPTLFASVAAELNLYI